MRTSWAVISDFFLDLGDVCSDDEDDTAELLAELERIKKERAEDKLRKVVFKSFAVLLLNSLLSYSDPNIY